MKPAADNLNAMNPQIAEALAELDPEPIRRAALCCREAGAKYVDVNPGYLSPKKRDRMVFMVEVIQENVPTPLILDSSDPEALRRGMEVCRTPPVLNGLTREPHRLESVAALAAEGGTDLVVLLMDERSQTPAGVEEKIALAVELAEHAAKAGVPLGKLIFDPILPHVSWPDAYFRISQALDTVRLLSSGAVFQEPVRTMVGLSNLRSGLRTRAPLQIEQISMALLAGAGLDMMLMDVLNTDLMETLRMIARVTDFHGP